MTKPKYEINTSVKMKHHEDVEFFITSIHTETCLAGTQVFYVGRMWIKGSMTKKMEVSEGELGEKVERKI